MNWDWAFLCMSPFLVLYGVIGVIGYYNNNERSWMLLSAFITVMWTFIFFTSLVEVLQ